MKIRSDLIVHFVLGLWFAGIGWTANDSWPAIGYVLTLPPHGVALLAAVLGGIGIEVVQHVTKRGTPDPLDAVATSVGGLVAALLIWAA